MQLVLSDFRPTLVAVSLMLLCLSMLWTTVASQPEDNSQTTEPMNADEDDQSAYCSRTSDLGLSHKLRKEAIKHELLLRLGFDEAPPNPDPSIEQPTNDPVYEENYRAALEVKEAYNSNEKPCTKLNTQERKLVAFFPHSVTGHPPITHPAHQLQNQKDKDEKYPGPDTPGVVFDERYRLKFSIDLVDVTSITNVIDYLQAELRLLKLPQFQVISSRVAQGIVEDRVEIRLIERPKNYLNQDLLIFITHQDLKVDYGYAVFNITRAITKWVERRNSLSGEMELEVLIRHPDGAPYGSTFEPGVQFSKDNQSIQLVLTVYDEEGNNVKRAAVTAAYSTENKERCKFQCCWRPLIVNFRRDYNWTWITQPETIEFNYCSGACPLNWAVDGEHVRLLSIHRRHVLDENPTAAPEPCCVPDSYRKELFVLNIKNRTEMVWVDDAIVTSCVCR